MKSTARAAVSRSVRSGAKSGGRSRPVLARRNGAGKSAGCAGFVDHPSFYHAGTEEKLFGQGASELKVPAWMHFPEVPEDVEVRRRGRATLTCDDEARLFLRHNYARRRLCQLVEAQRRRFCKSRVREIKLWEDRVAQARADLVGANMALVLAMAKRTRIPSVEFAELVSEGNMALLRSVDKFDVSRGFKFSTYACRAILKSFNRLASKTGRYRQHFPTAFDPELERSDYDFKRHQMQREDAIESLREILARNRANLTPVEHTIVTERFALSSRARKQTLAEVGKRVGLTNERVRQIQNMALAKIRAVLDSEFLAA